MTVETFLASATQQLKTAGIATARLDCLVLLEDELHTDRALLLAHLDQKISRLPLLSLNKKIIQKAQNVPLAYIRGKANFYGREFIVNKHVLVPRPESEKLIDLLKTINFGIAPNVLPLYIADVGTGSGCLGITAALEFPGTFLDLYDIDSSALAVAARNSTKHGLDPIPYFRQSDLLTQPIYRLQRPYDIVLVNLPYVPKDYQINDAAKHEPSIALFAGDDGLGLYRTFWRQLAKLTMEPTYVFTESFPFQHEQNQELAKIAGYSLQIADDFAQCFKLARAI